MAFFLKLLLFFSIFVLIAARQGCSAVTSYYGFTSENENFTIFSQFSFKKQNERNVITASNISVVGVKYLKVCVILENQERLCFSDDQHDVHFFITNSTFKIQIDIETGRSYVTVYALFDNERLLFQNGVIYSSDVPCYTWLDGTRQNRTSCCTSFFSIADPPKNAPACTKFQSQSTVYNLDDNYSIFGTSQANLTRYANFLAANISYTGTKEGGVSWKPNAGNAGCTIQSSTPTFCQIHGPGGDGEWLLRGSFFNTTDEDHGIALTPSFLIGRIIFIPNQTLMEESLPFTVDKNCFYHSEEISTTQIAKTSICCIQFSLQSSTSTTFATTKSVLATTVATTSSKLDIVNSTTENIRHTSGNHIILIICGSAFAIMIITALILFIFWRRKRRQQKQSRNQFLLNFMKAKFKISTVYDEWQLVWNQISLKNVIGSGAYGQILIGVLHNRILGEPDFEVAIKIPSKFANEDIKEQFLNEVHLMKQISGHQNIIKMFGCITVGERICLVLEFCENYDLLKYVKNLKSVESTEDDLHQIFFQFIIQIAEGLEFLTTKGIIHRDIAARNILIDNNKNAKLTDFGVSIQMDQKENSTVTDVKTIKLPLKWMAIESLKNYDFSFKSDIWSFGIVLFEMYSFGESPYADIADIELIEYLDTGNRLAKPDMCLNEMYEIMMKCWNKNRFERPTANELLKNLNSVAQN